jgi:hypothetical protein
MTGQPPAPGRDEMTVTAAAAGDVPTSPEHRRARRAAPVVVTFAELGRLVIGHKRG